MRDEYLPFEQCLDRLKHSFLRVTTHEFWGSYIDFQHPSLRDMLLILLQNEPTVRRQYILLASPQGLYDIIQGIPFFGLSPTDDVHTLIIRDEEELDLLCGRIRNVITDTIPANDQSQLLNSAVTLLPRKNKKIINAADVDLGRFLKSPSGKVIDALLQALANENTYRNNLTYKLSNWMDILEKFYQLAPYIVPVPHLSYITSLALQMRETDILDGLRFIYLLSVNEPIVFKQVFSQKLAQQWNKSLITKLDEYSGEGEYLDNISTGDKYDYEEKYSAYVNWKEKAEDLLELATIFYSFSQIQQPDEFSAFEDLLENISPPQQPEEEEEEEEEEDTTYKYKTDKSDKEYWTIERLFEDL